MAVQNTYLTNDGDLEQAKRKRAGEVSPLMAGITQPVAPIAKQTSFDVTNTPAMRTGDNPERAARMIAQANQPITVGGPEPMPLRPAAAGIPAPTPGSPMIEGLAGAAKAGLGIAAYPASAAYDGIRNLAGNLAGGNTDQIVQYRQGASDLISEGAGQMSDSAARLRESASSDVRGTLGIDKVEGAAPSARPAANPYTGKDFDQWPQKQSAPASASPSTAIATPPGTPTDQGSGFTNTGIGGDAAGGQIVARQGANGAPEFSNDPTAVVGARAMPASGTGSPLLQPGVSNMADDVALEKRGSINNVGNGIGGGISFGQSGDAAMALGRFERANQEREKMIQISRRGGIGEGGGRVTVVKDSSRAPTLQERQLARLDERQAQTEALRSQTQQGIMDGADQLMTGQLNRQKTQQDLETGQIGLQSQQRLAQLGAMMADPSLGADQQQAAREAYTSLSTPAKDRFKSQDVILGRDENGRDIRGTQLIDVTTGRPVTGIGEQMPGQNTAPAVGTRQGGYEFMGGDPSDKKNWRKA